MPGLRARAASAGDRRPAAVLPSWGRLQRAAPLCHPHPRLRPRLGLAAAAAAAVGGGGSVQGAAGCVPASAVADRGRQCDASSLPVFELLRIDPETVLVFLAITRIPGWFYQTGSEVTRLFF